MHKNDHMLAEAQSDLADKIVGEPCSFHVAINGSDDDESYYASEAGFIMRVIRGPSTKDEYAAVIELYLIDGSLHNRKLKGFEPTPLFSMKYSEEISRNKFWRLSSKPSFIATPNNTFRSEFLDSHQIYSPSEHRVSLG